MQDPLKMTGVCDRCGDVFEEPKDWRKSAGWRWNGENWEHKCPEDHYTMGHEGRLISHELAAAFKRIKELETALDQLNLRIAHESGPICDFLNQHKGEPGHREAREAYKWAVYGTAVAAQIVRGIKADEKDCPHKYAYFENGKLFCSGCGMEIHTVNPSE